MRIKTPAVSPVPAGVFFHSSHQRAQDFDYSDKADGERDNGDGELLTDHLGLDILRGASSMRRTEAMWRQPPSTAHHPANSYTPNHIMSVPATITAGRIYFPGIGRGSHVVTWALIYYRFPRALNSPGWPSSAAAACPSDVVLAASNVIVE